MIHRVSGAGVVAILCSSVIVCYSGSGFPGLLASSVTGEGISASSVEVFFSVGLFFRRGFRGSGSVVSAFRVSASVLIPSVVVAEVLVMSSGEVLLISSVVVVYRRSTNVVLLISSVAGLLISSVAVLLISSGEVYRRSSAVEVAHLGLWISASGLWSSETFGGMDSQSHWLTTRGAEVDVVSDGIRLVARLWSPSVSAFLNPGCMSLMHSHGDSAVCKD